MSIPQKNTPQRHGGKSPTQESFSQRHATLIALVLFGAGTTGYFIGLTSPMTASSEHSLPTVVALRAGEHAPAASKVIPATLYSNMAKVLEQTNRNHSAEFASLTQEAYTPQSTINIDQAEKSLSLLHRETRRAYSGAPPTVPHRTDQISSAACMTCHGEGLRSKSLRAGKMPHPYYSSCTQCHVEQEATFALATMTFKNSFEGVKDPAKGSRAYPGAPPTIPHSTWMRNDCQSCHGRTAASGLESSHPWRRNCLQCHGESSILNQSKLNNSPNFLPVPEISDSND